MFSKFTEKKTTKELKIFHTLQSKSTCSLCSIYTNLKEIYFYKIRNPFTKIEKKSILFFFGKK